MCSLQYQLFGKNSSFLYALESDKFIDGLNRHVKLHILKKFAIIQRLKKHKSKSLCKIDDIFIEKNTSAINCFTALKKTIFKIFNEILP